MAMGSILDPPPGQHLPFRHVAGPPPPPLGRPRAHIAPGCHAIVVFRPTMPSSAHLLRLCACNTIVCRSTRRRRSGSTTWTNASGQAGRKKPQKRIFAGISRFDFQGRIRTKRGRKNEENEVSGRTGPGPGERKEERNEFMEWILKGKRSVFERDVGTKMASKNEIRGQKGEKVT